MDNNPTPEQKPLYNIGVVSRMTNIPEATLRIWERRYQFPQTTRTTGGHRLYSQRDVAHLLWVKNRIAEGMQVRHAIRSMNYTEYALPSPLLLSSAPVNLDSLVAFQKKILDALMAHDIESANTIFGEALALYDLEHIVLDIIGPTLFAIGEAWLQDKITTATEHFATHYLRHQLLMWMHTSPPAYQVKPAVLACAPNELHEGSLLMLGVLLRRLRWPIIYLGQSMPLPDLGVFIEQVDPSIIVFVAMIEENARALAEWPQWLSPIPEEIRPIITYGGRAFIEHPYLVTMVPGTLLGTTVREGVESLDRLFRELNPYQAY
jgi:DNA-binding transcriptional MerR regulator